MAHIVISVPSGQFCADRRHIACLYDEAHAGEHRCTIFQQKLDKVTIQANGEQQRLLYKCKECLDRAAAAPKDKPIEPYDKLFDGWKFP